MLNLLSPRGAAILGVYSGLRPATEHQDYIINFDLDNRWITVGGIRYRLTARELSNS